MPISSCRRGEFLILLGFVIFLPLFEAPKNLLWLAYIVMWTINRAREHDFGGRWDGWDTLIAIWIASVFIIAPFAGLPKDEWHGALDVLRYGSLLWALKRSGYGDHEYRQLLPVIVLSTLIALAWAFWALYVSHTREALELNSVGHVNHSAIYVAITFGIALTLLLSGWTRWTIFKRVALISATFVLGFSIFLSGSRGAAGMICLFALLLGAAWWPRSRTPFIVLAVTLTFFIGAAFAVKMEVASKQVRYVKRDYVLAARDKIWNVALAGWKQYPVFGVGMDNFNQISPERLKSWDEKSGQSYNEQRYFFNAHAHNLYLNTLTERGVVGLAALLAVLIAWAWALWKRRPRATDDALACALWGGAFSAWLISVGVGTVNTTLHHEHALLSMLLLGAWLARQPKAA